MDIPRGTRRKEIIQILCVADKDPIFSYTGIQRVWSNPVRFQLRVAL